MRYLNKYKHYKESIDYKNILEDIEDILLPIKDLGYNDIKAKLVKEYEYYIFSDEKIAYLSFEVRVDKKSDN